MTENNNTIYSDWLKINEFISDPEAHAYVLICQKLIDKGFLTIKQTEREMGFVKYEFTLNGGEQNG